MEATISTTATTTMGETITITNTIIITITGMNKKKERKSTRRIQRTTNMSTKNITIFRIVVDM